MKFTKLMLSVLAILSVIPMAAQARHHGRHHGPRVSFGFAVGSPYYRPAFVAPCYGGYCRPVYAYPGLPTRQATPGRPYYAPVYAAPVVYAPVRPSFGVSFGSGPVSFGFGF